MNIDKFHVVAEIARGGMGILYLAEKGGAGGFSKLFILKVLRPELAENAGFIEMFLEEARLSARLSHPNIVQTYEVGEESRRYFMVMEYLDGVPLSRVLQRVRAELTLAMKVSILLEVLAGLAYAHSMPATDQGAAHLVHRDVNPQNVFLTYDGQVKLVDFGVAKAADSRLETQAGVLKGKPAFMAPEQLKGAVSPQVDIFAVGMILWDMLADRPPWGKLTDVQVLTSLIGGHIPSIEENAPDAPEELRRICARAIAKDPADRYATAEAMREELLAYLRSSGTPPDPKAIAPVIARAFEKNRQTVEEQIRSARAHASDSTPLLVRTESEAPSIALHKTPIELQAPPTTPAELQAPPATPPGLQAPLATPPGLQAPPATLAPPAESKKQRLPLLLLLIAATAVIVLIVLFRPRASGTVTTNAAVSAEPSPQGGTALAMQDATAPSSLPVVPVEVGSVAQAPSAAPRALLAPRPIVPIGGGGRGGGRVLPSRTAALAPSSGQAPIPSAKPRVDLLDDTPHVHLIDEK